MRIPTNHPAEFGNQLVDDFGQITPPDAEQARAARLYVAGKATDADDARTLLDMLGLGVTS